MSQNTYSHHFIPFTTSNSVSFQDSECDIEKTTENIQAIKRSLERSNTLQLEECHLGMPS